MVLTAASQESLTDINAGRAYWVNTPSFEGLKVDIPKQAAGVAQVLPTINIAKGWNLIPILDVDGDFELDDSEDYNYFNGLSEGTVSGIYTFNTITNSWSSVAEEGVRDRQGLLGLRHRRWSHSPLDGPT